MNSLYLDAFYACAQTRNFTRAAEKLYITQSALSQRIKNLEGELGTTLIIRDRAGLRLTERGEELLRYCQTKEALEAEVAGRLRKGAGALSGQLRIGGFSSVMRSVILPALAPLLEKHDGVRLKLIARELAELPALLRSGEIDFMVLDQKLEGDGLVAAKLGVERNVLVQKRGYKGAEVYLDHDEKDATTAKYLRRKSAAGLTRNYLDDVYGLIDGVKLGLGQAVLPLHLVAGAKELEVLEPGRTHDIPVVLHYFAQPFYTKLHQAAVEALTARVPALLKN
ncbi:MAG TPA: LysR family transcriptional regulator [Bdellovibrionales bacterium]|nr:LysR family transcriptional regulator [Bdellovibrionales bacterium]